MYQRYFNHKRRGLGPSSNRKSTREIVEAIRAMEVSPKSGVITEAIYTPKHTFWDLPIADKLKKNIQYKKYLSLTPIQDAAIPSIIEGSDVIGIANTGTGKTAAFLIPLINKVMMDKSQRVLIITPTRELALQISNELYGFIYGISVGWTVCVGGMSIGKQKSDLSKKPGFIIGTPGRLKDLCRTGSLHLDEFNNVVLDEADRMVDMGFIRDIKYFISGLPPRRQSLFFSATIPPKVAEILHSFVKNAVTVSVKSSDNMENIKQELINVNGNLSKLEKLQQLLSKQEFKKVLIFGRTKRGVQKLSDTLSKKGFHTAAIHGNKNQGQRQRALDDFKNNRISILLATDVASRGIDIRDISHVINYDLPGTYEDYVHRIGRTGRADKKGVALTFVEN